MLLPQPLEDNSARLGLEAASEDGELETKLGKDCCVVTGADPEAATGVP